MKQLCKCMRDHVGSTCMVLSVILVLTMILATGIGPVSIPFGTVWRVVWNYLTGAGDVSDIKMSTQNIVWHLRATQSSDGSHGGSQFVAVWRGHAILYQKPAGKPLCAGNFLRSHFWSYPCHCDRRSFFFRKLCRRRRCLCRAPWRPF